jgi:hypothetical protein
LIYQQQIDLPLPLPLKLDFNFFAMMSLKFNCARLADTVKKLGLPKSGTQPMTLNFDPEHSGLTRRNLYEGVRKPNGRESVCEGKREGVL